MGIKNLNRFLKENCTKKSIRNVSLGCLTNKVVVIDTSIYMYRYLSDNALLENMYLLISTLLENSIIPYFVFDGKPPPEKQSLLKQRRLEKKEAEKKYNQLHSELDSNERDIDIEERKTMQKELHALKQQFVRLHGDDIKRVKELLDAYGVMYYDSPNEADEICAYMVNSGKAWACLSDDMDMFLYGCPRVLRNISLLKSTVLLYDTNEIFNELCMSHVQFKEIMVLSGTDYNIHGKTNLDTTIELFSKYKQIAPPTNVGFYEWLLETGDYISNHAELLHICDLFNMEHIQKEELDNVDIKVGPADDNVIRNIMTNEGFVFTPTTTYNTL